MRVAFLGHNQPTDKITRPTGGYLAKGDAEALVRDFLAERISQKVIRAFPPESSFRLLTVQGRSKLTFGSGEVSGTRFRQPSDPAWQELHGPAARSLRTRSYMTLKAWKQKFAAPPEMPVSA